MKKSDVKKMFVWLSLKKFGLRSILGGLLILMVALISVLILMGTKNPAWRTVYRLLGLETVGPCALSVIFIDILGGSMLCFFGLVIYELFFGKSIFEEWLKRAEGIRNRHPETSATLYFLERGDISYLTDWIRAYDDLKYDDNKNQLRGLLEERGEFDQRINISEERLRRIATQLQVSSPSDDELRLPSKFRWQYYDLR